MGIQGGEEIVYVGGLLQLTVKDYRKQKKKHIKRQKHRRKASCDLFSLIFFTTLLLLYT